MAPHDLAETDTTAISRLKIRALSGKDAPNNVAILRLIALRGPMNKYDLFSVLPGKNLPGKKKEKNYPTVSRRVDDLVSRGYLAVAGSKITREGTKRQEKVNVFGLTWRGLIASLSEEEVVVDVVSVLQRHEKSLQFPGRDIAMKVLERWPEDARHDAKLLWTSVLKVLPSDIEEIPQDRYAAYLLPSIATIDEQLSLPQRMDSGFFQELLKDPTIREWAKRETVKTIQQLRKQLTIFQELAKSLGVEAE
jgi:hypothetical protein